MWLVAGGLAACGFQRWGSEYEKIFFVSVFFGAHVAGGFWHVLSVLFSHSTSYLCSILAVDSIEHIHQPVLGGRHDGGHHSKVIEDEPAVSVDCNVARVGVRVQEAMFEDLHKVGFRGSPGNSGGVYA